ncbi:hypothetical protein PS710_01372 [Pseudomonas fluorescens]|uniref:Uncharacterized protein n=1 Tax=Pseudomonas fluorescens TaxID=294 RepID=A0A5E7AZS7_PSEFL|nr:hypothetical protein PS710_01372 [Pseudomonas fluorescens]
MWVSHTVSHPPLNFVHQQNIGRLAVRLRWQASSYKGFGYSRGIRLAGRPPRSRSKDCSLRQLLPLVSVHPREIGWLAGRQDQDQDQKIAAFGSSYLWSAYIRERLVGWQAVFAGKPAPTFNRCTPFAPHHSSGRALARLQLLILIHPPLREAEWRCSSGEWRAAPFDAVEHAACRSSRSQPAGCVPG